VQQIGVHFLPLKRGNMSSSTFERIVPWKNPALWKGAALGAGVLVLALTVFVLYGLSRPRYMSRRPFEGIMSSTRLAAVRTAGGEEAEELEPNVVQADAPKIIHKAQLQFQVGNCAETQKKIEALAVAESGFLESSTLEGNSAEIVLRVPSARFDAVRSRLRELAIRVREDSVSAADVSKQYIDREARLRNLRAEEQQFLEIMKKAHTVPDVLAVTKELSQVRGEIETADAEFRHLRDQIEMSQITVKLTSETPATGWSPGASVKTAFADLLESLGSFGDFLIWLVVNVPVIVLWVVTIFLLAALAWYVLKKAVRIMRFLFGKKPGKKPAEARPAPEKS
jgi:hypothetical protein